MKFLIFFAAALLLISSAFAQSTGNISGSIISNNQKAIGGATISLLRGRDSSVVKLFVANKEGQFAFEKVADGKYFVSVTAVGHQKKYSNLIEINAQQQSVQIPPISLLTVSKSLANVAVTTNRPMVEQRVDRTIVNVDASVTNIGTSALEVLEKSPGITVDREGNISLKGKEGVLVLVDGRPTQLGGADLANLLRNMSSNQMDQIEIMTNPPARYDAAGNAGIINIKTKKTVTAGYNGSINIGYVQGKYPKTNEGFNFNYRSGKVNVFTNLSHNYRKGFENLSLQRNIFTNPTNTLENYFDQSAHKLFRGNSYNGKVGLDYFAGKKTTIGIVLSKTYSPSSVSNNNVTDILNSSKNLESITKASVDNTSDWKSFSSNLNFKRVIDAKGKELTADLDFVTYGSGNRQFMVNSYFDINGNSLIKSDTLKGYLPQNIKVYSGRIDYIHPVNKTSKFEAGLKSSIVRTDNNANYDSIQYGAVVHDFGRSNHFNYEENINAAYANFSTQISKKVTAQLGLRAENTNTKGKQLTTGENFERAYTQLFPTAYFQYKPNDKHNFGLNYGRRVRRPNYESLNPFIRFIDRYTYSQGNPNLKPSLSNNIELTHTWRNLLTTTFNYTATNDIINSVIEQKGREAYQKPSNIASLRQFGISLSSNTPVNKWWTSSINFNGFRNKFEGIVNNTPISFSAISFIVNTTQQFKINKTLTGEITGRYRSGWLEGVIRVRPIGFMGGGFSQQIMKGKGTLRLTVRDIFYTQKLRAISKYGNVDVAFQEMFDSSSCSWICLSLYKRQKIAPSKRTTGSANEEEERIGIQ